MATKIEELQKIREEILNLKGSPLYFYRIKNNYKPVIGEGNLDAEVVFVGEAPGRNEALVGRPFIGAAGKLFDSLLSFGGIKRSDVYITNIVNDRPPGNRDPKDNEVDMYKIYQLKQIKIIKPKVIATVGRISMRVIFEEYNSLNNLQPISKIHGKVFTGKADYGGVVIFPLYHPAAALYSPKLKEDMKKDISTMASLIKPAKDKF